MWTHPANDLSHRCGLLLLRLVVSTLGLVQFVRWYSLYDAAATHLRVDTRPYLSFLYELDACVASILVLQLTAVSHIVDFSTGCFATHSWCAQLAYAAFAAANALHAQRWVTSVLRTRLFLRPGDDLPDSHYDAIVATTKRRTHELVTSGAYEYSRHPASVSAAQP